MKGSEPSLGRWPVRGRAGQLTVRKGEKTAEGRRQETEIAEDEEGPRGE